MDAELNLSIICAYCGQRFDLAIEADQSGQEMITDCEVCCRPLRVIIPNDPDTPAQVEPA